MLRHGVRPRRDVRLPVSTVRENLNAERAFTRFGVWRLVAAFKSEIHFAFQRHRMRARGLLRANELARPRRRRVAALHVRRRMADPVREASDFPAKIEAGKHFPKLQYFRLHSGAIPCFFRPPVTQP